MPRIHKTNKEVCRVMETQKQREKALYDRTGRDLAAMHNAVL